MNEVMSMNNNVIKKLEVFLINHNIHAESEFSNSHPSAKKTEKVSISLELKKAYYIL